jgi:hypothetical protein
MIERGRTKVGRNATDHRYADVDLAHRRLQLVDHVAGRLQLLQPAQRRSEIELDAGEQLPEFVVQLAGEAGALFLAHPFDPLR